MKLKVLVLLLGFAVQAHAAVWTNTQSWSPTAEANYQDWVRTHWSKDVFNEPGPLQGVILDCADGVYSMRLLYAYENGLPFAVKDPSSNRTISNDMSRFNSITDSAKRFRAFALYLYDTLGTLSLTEDSYAVATTRDAIHAGVFLKTDKASHHSWTVQDVDRAGVPFLLFASRPAQTTLHDRHYIPSMGFLWGQQDVNGDQVSENLHDKGDPAAGVGYRMYRYPQDLLKPEWQVPGYSTAQFQMEKIQWGRVVQKAIQLAPESADEIGARLLDQACKEASDRIPVVQDALRAQSSRGGDYCFNATEYDDLSTPSKDSRSRSVFEELASTYKHNGSNMSPALRERVASVVSAKNDQSYCPIAISSSTTLTLGQVVKLASKWSSNPNDTLRARWGLDRKSSHAASCPTY